MDRKEAVLTDAYLPNLDDAIRFLIEARKNEENIYIDFNGVKLYSANITEYRAYRSVVGTNKQNYENKKQFLNFSEKEKIDALFSYERDSILNKYYVLGMSSVHSQKQAMWLNYVDKTLDSIYKVTDIDDTIILINMLNRGVTVEKVKETMDMQGHANEDLPSIINAVLLFADRGPEFVKFADTRRMKNPNFVQRVKMIEKENERIKQERSNNNERIL